MLPVRQLFSALSADERRTIKRLLIAVFVLITLFNLGFWWQREFREMAQRRNVQLVLRGWDGLAWYVWMPAAPAILLLIRRCPFARGQAGASLARLAAGSGGIYFIVTNTRYLLRILPNAWLPPEADLPVSWSSYLNTQLERTPLDFMIYCGLFAASYAIDYSQKARQRADEVMRLQVNAARLQEELVRLQLTSLRGQLHPHFLFNSFNAIATLVRQGKNAAAVETIAQLGDLLRFVMEKFDQEDLPLADEIDFIRCYLEVERVRFGDKLRVTLEVDPEAQAGVVPSLILQPLVENAIKHGIAQRLTAGRVRIAAERRGGQLHLEVENDGPERSEADARPQSSGIGLNNTRRRLDHAYGSSHRFESLPRVDGGMKVTIDLPWREAVGNVGRAGAGIA